jgi:hypothetical protein
VIDPAGIPQITGDMDALSGHAAAITRVAADFADTGGRVDGTWQELAGVYRAPEAAQLLAATAPVRTVSASVGEDLGAVGTALAAYATTVAEIKTRLEALRADALAFVGSVGGDDGWREDEGRVDEHNRLVSDVNAAVADFTDAQRTCANSILALHGERRWVAENGDGVLGPDEFGYSAEVLDAAMAEDDALPWGSAEEHDRGFLGDVGAYFGGVGQGAVDMVTGLGALIGYADGGWSWSTAGTAWAGLGTFAGALVVYSTPGGVVLDQTTGLFGQERGHLGGTLLNAGKSIIAYDTWGEDPQRAAGMTTFNVVSAILGTKGAGAGLRGVGAAAQGSRFATVVRFGAGATRAGEFLGGMPTVRGVIASLADRFPQLHVPHVDLPPSDAPTSHIDAPSLPGAGQIDLPDGPSIDDAIRTTDTGGPGAAGPNPLSQADPVPGAPSDPHGARAVTDVDRETGPGPGPDGEAGPGTAGPEQAPARQIDQPVDPHELPVSDQLALAEREIAEGARTFPDDVAAARYGADHWNDYVDALPAEQRTALRDYTVEPPHHAPTYVEINGHLRGQVPPTPEVLRHIDEIDRALAGNPLPEDVLVTRGTGLSHIVDEPPDLIGSVQVEDAYLSTSLGGPADAFAGKPAVLHLRVPAGTPAIWVERISDFGAGERELLLGRGLSYRVTDVVLDGGQWQVYGEVLPG